MKNSMTIQSSFSENYCSIYRTSWSQFWDILTKIEQAVLTSQISEMVSAVVRIAESGSVCSNSSWIPCLTDVIAPASLALADNTMIVTDDLYRYLIRSCHSLSIPSAAWITVQLSCSINIRHFIRSIFLSLISMFLFPLLLWALLSSTRMSS